MRQKESAQRRRKKRGRFMTAAAAAAAAAALLVSPVFASEGNPGTGSALTVQQALTDSSVTVTAPADENYTELADAGVTMDFYKIASADLLEGHDGYTLTWAPEYAGQEAYWNAAAEKAEQEGRTVSAADVEGLAQQLAGVVLADTPVYAGKTTKADAAPEGAVKYGVKPGEAVRLGTDPGPGLYLIIAHGDFREYKIQQKDKPLSTAAVGQTKLFQFAPILVSVPQRGEEMFDETGTIIDFNGNDPIGEYPIGTGNTGSGNDWEKDLVVAAKVGVTDRTGSLKITKTLNTHELVDFGGRRDPATFVFEVKVTTEDGDAIYNNVFSMIFDEAGGPQEKVITGLPVGAIAEVTEVYAGNYGTEDAYTKENGKAIVIQADIVTTAGGKETREIQTDTAEFTNDYEDKWNGGGSVTNTYDPKVTIDTDGSDKTEWDLSDVGQTFAQETNGQ